MPWNHADAESLYNVSNWGRGYFRVNPAGNLEVTPEGREAMARVERALAARFGALIEGDPREVVPVLKDLISGIGASLDREGGVGLRS